MEELLLSTSLNTSSGSTVLVIPEIRDEDQSSRILSSSTIYNESLSCQLPHMMQPGAVCAKCQKSDRLHQALFSYERENVRSYLKSEFDGVLALAAIEKHGDNVPEPVKTNVLHLLIQREAEIVLKRERASLQHPLEHFSVDYKILAALADELKREFGWKATLYFDPPKKDTDGSLKATGKLVTRVDYVRRLLQRSGLCLKKDDSTDNTAVDETEAEFVDVESQLALLREPVVDWEETCEAWKRTYTARTKNSKKLKECGSLVWQLEEFPCFTEQGAVELVNYDFATRCPDNKADPLKNWYNLRHPLEKFLRTKKIVGEEADQFFFHLDDASDCGKDCAILLLLPSSLKAPKLREGEFRVPKRLNKRRKEETEEEKVEKKEIRETFIVHVQSLEQLDEFTTSRIDAYSISKRNVTPFTAIVGRGMFSEASFWSVLGKRRYQSVTPAEAVILTNKLFFVFKLSYPTEGQQVWLLIQRAILEVPSAGVKAKAPLGAAIEFLEKAGKVKICD